MTASSASLGRPLDARAWLLAAAAIPALAALVYRFDAPLVLGGAAVVMLGIPLLVWPEAATLLTGFLLYTNVPYLAYKFHGVPRVVAATFILLLALPLLHHLLRHGRAPRTDRVLGLLVLYGVVLVLATPGSVSLKVAASQIQTHLIEGILLYWLVLNVVRDRAALRRLLAAVLLAGSLLGVAGLYQTLTGSYGKSLGGLAMRDQWVEYDMTTGERLRVVQSHRAQGPVDDPNKFAQVLIVLLPLAVALFRTGHGRLARVGAAGAGALILVGIVLSSSRGAFLNVIVLAGLMGLLRWVRPRYLVGTGLALVLLLPVVNPEYLTRITSIGAAGHLDNTSSQEADAATLGRVTEMLAASHAVLDHPLLGVGPGQYLPYYSVRYQQIPELKLRDLTTRRQAHSLYIGLAADIGLIGLAAFLAIPVFLLRRLWRAQGYWRDRDPEHSVMAVAFCLSILAYLGTGVFLSFSHERYYWLLIALAGAALQSMDASAAGRPTADAALPVRA